MAISTTSGINASIEQGDFQCPGNTRARRFALGYASFTDGSHFSIISGLGLIHTWSLLHRHNHQSNTIESMFRSCGFLVSGGNKRMRICASGNISRGIHTDILMLHKRLVTGVSVYANVFHLSCIFLMFCVPLYRWQ